MSEINQETQQPGLTPEEELALEEEREAAREARLAPFRTVNLRITSVEDAMIAISEVVL